MSDRPLEILESSLGEAVTVRLKEGEVYEGVLAGYDQHMNLVLEGPARIRPTGEEASSPEAGAGLTIIRGDNLVSITR